jgi:NAD(P)-dependent dehydrogenase (short-subunit alcohol dehydrogenase family)
VVAVPHTLHDKVALITGGAAGIGQASARLFARQGAKVVIADVDVDGGAATVRAIKAEGGSALFVATDVSSASEVAALIDKTVGAYGRLDCAVNNAGIQGELKPSAECSEENWDRVVAINLKGVWLCLKYEIGQMLQQGGGAIVNIGSNFGLVGSVGMPAYSAAKHGVVGLSKTAALEYATSAIRVNALCPGPVQTPMIDKILRAQPELGDQIMASIKAREPMRRLGRPEEIAEAALWLCSDAASFVTGAVLSVDGGFVAQ